MSNYTCPASPPATTQPGSDALAPEPVSSTARASTGNLQAALSDPNALTTDYSGWTPRLGSTHLSWGAIEQAKAFAGPEHRVTVISGPAEFVRDAAGAVVNAITPPATSQTSYSDLP